jgi:hypothetical protein
MQALHAAGFRLSRRAVRVHAQAVWFLVGAAMLWSLGGLLRIWVALLLGERPQSWAMVGGLLVLGAATTRGVLTARAATSGTASQPS